MNRQIGLDFSTTTTALAYQDRNGLNTAKPEMLTFNGRTHVPTLILRNGTLTSKKGLETPIEEAFGWDAAGKKKAHALLERNFKMGLISKNPTEQEKARMLTKKFFSYLYEHYKNTATVQKGADHESISTVVTYPAKFPKDVQDFLKQAAMDAGFQNVKLLDESKAAMAFSLTYETDPIRKHVDRLRKNKLKVMIIDMGAGTTDIAIFEYDTADSSQFVHLCSWPEVGGTTFGGSEIDSILCEFYKKILGTGLTAALGMGNSDLGDALLSSEVKDFKEQVLSEELKYGRIASGLPGTLGNIAYSMDIDEQDAELSRETFEKLLADYLRQFPDLVKGALRKAGLSASNIDLVLLTGGHSQWYFVKDMLTKLGISAKAVFGFADPHLVVAKGAALYVEPKTIVPPVQKSTTDVKPDNKIVSQTPPTEEPKFVSKPVTKSESKQDSNFKAQSFAIVKVKTSYGAEQARLFVNPESTNKPPVKIEMIHRPFCVQFMPELLKIRNNSHTNELVLTDRGKEYIVIFAHETDAEAWYNKIHPLIKLEPRQASGKHANVSLDDIFPLSYDPQSLIRPVIAGTSSHIFAARKDGSVLISNDDGYYSQVKNWKGIVSIAAQGSHIVGLRNDGTVLADGNNKYGQCEVFDWKNIVAVAAGETCTVGLRADGTVVCAGKLKESSGSKVKDWNGIVAIAISGCGFGWNPVWGIRKNGDLLCSDGTYRHFNDVRMICGGSLPSDLCVLGNNGKLYTTSCIKKAQIWSNIAAISMVHHLVGLKEDGTVLADGLYKGHDELNVSSWRNVIAIAAGENYTVGLTSEGRFRLAYKKKRSWDPLISANELSTWKLF